MKNILDSRKIIDTKNQESLLKQIEAKVKDNNVPVLEGLLASLASLDNSLLNQVSEIWDLAVEPGRVEALEVLLENTEFKKNINVTNNTGLTPLMRAAKLDNASAVRKLLAAGAEYKILSVFSSEKTVLHYAIESGKARVLRVLINSKLMSLEILNELLMLAVLKNNSDAIKVLLKAGADITIQTAGNPYEWDGTVLHMAVSSDKIEILDLLLKHQDINQVLNLLDGGKYTPLMYAAFLGHEDAVKKLIRAGADITIRIKENPYGWNGATALHIAAEVSIIEVLELLLGHRDIKKILDLPGGDGYTALMGAAIRGRKDAVSKLIEAGADVTIQVIGNSEWNGYTALHMAVYYNKIEILELLLKHKDIKKVLNLPGKNGYTPLMRAADAGHADAVSKLIEAGADITIQITGNPDGWDGATALYLAAFCNKIEVLELLLKHEDIKKILNFPKRNGYTPLMCAAWKGHEDAVSKLIDAGADITIQITDNPDGWDGATALHIAASLNKIGILELLLKHKDIKKVLNLPNKNGFTPLICAAMGGHADVVSKLIEAGVDITIQVTGNSNAWGGYTALHIAASKGHADAVGKLIEAGANVTIQVTGNSEWNGYTALHMAVYYNKIEILELLLKYEDIKKVLNLPGKNGLTPLMHAAEKGHSDAVSRLIDAGADITIQVTGNSDAWDGGATVLHIAAFKNKIEVLELFLRHQDIREVLNFPSKDGYTPLMDAVSIGDTDTVSSLIEAGADITIQVTGNSDGWDGGATVLHIAVFYNKIEVLELLLKHQDIKKVLNLPNKNGFTPLMRAARGGHADAVSKLIEAGADITAQIRGNSNGWGGYTALYIAASLNKIEVLELLLKHKDIKKVLNLPNKNGRTPLMRAAKEGHADTVSKLIEAGADIAVQITGNSKGWNGYTALHIAAYHNKIEMLELLFKHKDTKKVLNLPDKEGYTPLMRAASKGHADAVSKLIEAGADITIQVTGNSKGLDGATALYIAAFKNKIEVLELLLKHQDIREVLNLPNKNGFTPLMYAAVEGHADAVSKLIEAGADITIQVTGNYNGWDGSTALHMAASLNKIGILELLLRHQDIREVLNLPNKNGFTPLMYAAVEGHADAVSKLIESGADITIQVTGNSNGWDGSTALHMAASLNKIGILELLLRHQDIREVLNLPNKNGFTPLMYAAVEGHADAVSKLIESGADITIRITGNSDGWDGGATVLHMAVFYNKIELLELLLKHKDIKKVLNLPNKNGFTPLMRAARGGHADAVSKLIEAGADITIQVTGNSKGLDGLTALYIAASLNKIEVLELLLKHKDTKKVLNLPDREGFTPLMRAAFKGHTDAVSKLIEAGADITIQVTGNSNGWGGYTALYIAAFLNKIEVLELLFKHKDIKQVLNLPKQNGYTPLMGAASKGHADAVSKLIEAGADITIQVTGNSKGLDGLTALYIAASLNKIEVLELLLKHKDTKKVLNLPNKNGFTPLMRAAFKGHTDAVSKLIEAGADITIQVTGNSNGWGGYTALYIAAFLNKIEVLELLFKHKDTKKVLNLLDKEGFTPLMDAAFKGHTDTVGKLIEAGADITIEVTGNSNVWGGYTALHIAVYHNKIEMLELLFKHKDTKKVLNLPDKEGFTPLMRAASKGHADAVSKLIEAGADITAQITGNSKGLDGVTALYLAASLNKIEVLELLLKHQDIREVLNLPNKNGYTPLMDAARGGHTDTVGKLIEAGADITAQIRGNSDGWDGATALYLAASLNKIEVLELLLKHQDIREVLNIPGKNGLTPLMDAAFKRHTDTVGKLIEAGADITIQVTGNYNGWGGYTALYIAASFNKIGILELLLKHQDIKKVLNLPNKNGFTPLMDAVYEGHADTVSRLIEAGADITIQVTGNSKESDGVTALNIAASFNKIGILELLLKHQDIRKVLNLPDKEGFTPLMDAVMGGHADAVSRLIEAGADITIQVTGNSKGLDGVTALYIAVYYNKIEVLELLLKHKDIKKVLNLPNKNGFTPLMRAAKEGHADAVSKLIEAGVDITIQVTGNSDGWDGATALYIAVYYNKIEVLELLLKHQDIREVLNIPGKNGLTPLMRAASKGHTDIVGKLIEAGADITVQNHKKNTAAHLAAKYQKGKSLGMLIDKAPKVLEMLNETGHTPGELLNSRHKRSSSEVSIFSNGAEGGGKQKRRRIQTNLSNR